MSSAICCGSLTPKQAIKLQQELRSRVRLEDDLGEIRTVAGVDLKIGIGAKMGRCGVTVLSFPEPPRLAHVLVSASGA